MPLGRGALYGSCSLPARTVPGVPAAALARQLVTLTTSRRPDAFARSTLSSSGGCGLLPAGRRPSVGAWLCGCGDLVSGCCSRVLLRCHACGASLARHGCRSRLQW